MEHFHGRTSRRIICWGCPVSAPPRLPIHIGDYMKDTPSFSRHSWEHHGIYFIALMICWNTPDCSLPDDPEWLRLRLGCSKDEFNQYVAPTLSIYFKKCADGRLRQKRLSEERAFIDRWSKSQSAKARKRKSLKKNGVHSSPGIAPALLEQNSGIAPALYPIPIPLESSAHNSAPPSRGCRLPVGWTPSEEGLALASSLGLAASTILENFRDYWIAVPGSKGTKRDWEATWRNWCRREAERLKPRRPEREIDRW